MLMTPSCTFLSLLQIQLLHLKYSPILSLTYSPGWTLTNCSSIHPKLNSYSLIQNNNGSNFLNAQLYLSAMISSQSVLLVIFASSLILTCHSQIKLTPCLSLVIFISESSVVFVISFLFLQLQRLPIHLSPANLIIVIHSTMEFRKLTWTKYSAYKILWLLSLQIHQNLNTLHQYSKNYIGFQSNNASITNWVFLHIKRFKFSNLLGIYLYNSLSFPFHSLSTRSSDSSVLSIPYVRTSLGKRALSYFINFSTVILVFFQRQYFNTTLSPIFAHHEFFHNSVFSSLSTIHNIHIQTWTRSQIAAFFTKPIQSFHWYKSFWIVSSFSKFMPVSLATSATLHKTRQSDSVLDHPILLHCFLPSVMAHSSSFSWLVMLSWILALLLWTLLTWTFDQSGASRNLLHSTTILLTIPQIFCHLTKHGSNLPTLTILFHLWHLLVIQSYILLVSLVKVVVLLSFFDHFWNSNFSALATHLHLNLSNWWLLNFQLATRKPSFLTSTVLHLPKYLLFLTNSRTYSKFLFHHHLSSSSVVTSISTLTLIKLLLTNFLASLIISISLSTSTLQLTMMVIPLIFSSLDPALLLSHTFLNTNPTSLITNLSLSNSSHTSVLQPNEQPSNTAPKIPLMLTAFKSDILASPLYKKPASNASDLADQFSSTLRSILKFSKPSGNAVDLSDVGVAGSFLSTAWNSEPSAIQSYPSFPKPNPHFCPIL